jgi:hypothetical protein
LETIITSDNTTFKKKYKMKETLYKYRLFFFGLFIPLLMAGYVPGVAEFIAATKTGNGYTAKWDGSGYVAVKMDTIGTLVTLATNDQTLTGNRTVTLGSNTFSFAGLTQWNGDTTMSVTPSGQIVYSIPGGNIQNHTTGTTLTILATTETVYVDPATVLSSLTITMPTPTTNKEIEFHFGGTIVEGNPVVNVLTFPSSVYGRTGWLAASGADGFVLRYNTTNSKWYFK